MNELHPTLRPTLPAFGLIHGMDASAYRAQGGLSYTGLKWFARSPAHYFAWVRDERRPIIERKGQLEGTLAHAMTLEPNEIPFRYAIGPELSRATREWKAFAASHPALVAIKPSEAAAASAQAASVRALPDVAALLADGQAEVSAFWQDPSTAVLCQCRPDWVHPVEGVGVILVDLKTYADASPAEFARQVARKRYHWQAAWYADGYSLAAGVPVVGFVFIAVESEWPYAASAVMLDEESLDIARKEIRPLVEAYAQCNAANVWPSYSPHIEQIQLPSWYAGRFADTEW